MMSLVLLTGRLYLSPLLLLIVQILIGVISYAGMSLITNNENFYYHKRLSHILF